MAVIARLLPGLIDRIFDEGPDAMKGTQPGDYEVETNAEGQTYFWFICPGCTHAEPLYIRPVVHGPAHASWDMLATPGGPTLSPSIDHRVANDGCGWHGYLSNGVFASVQELSTAISPALPSLP